MMMSPVEELYEKTCGMKPVSVQALPASGSSRRYWRLTDGKESMIGCLGTSAEENRAFLEISGHFRRKGLNVPGIIAAGDDNLCYLQEDLGGETLFEHRNDEKLLMETMERLPEIQYSGADGLDFSICYPQREFDARMVSFDQNYFKYCFLKPSGIEFNEILLDEEFKKMSGILLGCDTGNTFMYRDFQARNVMIRNGEPWFIDYQGGRRGPIYYDVASFIWQARAGYGPQLREKLKNAYIVALRRFREVDEADFDSKLRQFVLFRTIQVLGAYGFRGLFERKQHFIDSIPYAVDNLDLLLEHPFEEYPYLCSLLHRISDKFRRKTEEKPDYLTVRVYSFSYKKGIPDDIGGNGGGYVFDCRALENPGRYEPYKKKTGLDADVIGFLEKDGGIVRFLERIYPMAGEHVEMYLKRHFTDLMFCFGCTGGQHRSVYSAQHLADHIRSKYPQVKVEIIHRELPQ